MALTFRFTPEMHRTLVFIENFNLKHERRPSGMEIAMGLQQPDSNTSRMLKRLLELELVGRRESIGGKGRPMYHYAVTARGREWL